MKHIYLYILFACAMIACEPFVDADIQIPALPEAPQISVSVSPDNPNLIVIKDMSDGFFSRIWDLPGGSPTKSQLVVDSILYTKKGTYTITLHAAKEGGGGTSTISHSIEILEDAKLACTKEIINLAGGCENLLGKCWTLSKAPGAVSVGPTPGSSEWFSSPQDGLVPEQYDDSFCFIFDGSSFQYRNNGQTVDPWNGYQAIDYDPPTDFTYFLKAGGGPNGETRIELPEGAFMGVWDSGPVYDIVNLSADELVVRSQIIGTEGWFELTFVAR